MVPTPPYNDTYQSDPTPSVTQTNGVFLLGVTVVILVAFTYGVVLVLSLTRSSSLGQLQVKAKSLDTQLNASDIAAITQQYNAVNAVVSHMTQLRQSRFVLNPVWNEIKSSVPKDMQFTTVSMDADHTFTVSGITKSVSSVAAFSQSLSTQPGVSAVVPLSVQRQSDQSTYSFTVTFKVSTKPATTTSGAGS